MVVDGRTDRQIEQDDYDRSYRRRKSYRDGVFYDEFMFPCPTPLTDPKIKHRAKCPCAGNTKSLKYCTCRGD